ncbi:MAG: 30S ribosomal protein S27e [Candidatus Rehaiarchaeum fermentans]|nr:30S ribosomal protein S27e [Candidatus Rehaiarchaeum fermentans]
MEEIIFKSLESKFIKVKCKKCEKEQVIFERASHKLYCLNCKEIIAEPTGGKVKLTNAELLEKFY